MSEYQYYEFQAIDRPLDEDAMAALRAISTRAEITPTSLTNVYHFGNFKGNPDRLMEQYFDAHFYVANWGTRCLILRLPARSLPLATITPYIVDNTLEARATKEHVILHFHSDSDEGDEDFEEGEGWLASLIGLRSDLLAGDLRCLYLAWLSGVENDSVDEDTPEPPVVPGLRKLTGPLSRFIEFLRLDPKLVEVAATTSGEALPSVPPTEELAVWIAELPWEEKDQVLMRLIQGEGVPLVGELLQRYRKDHTRKQKRTGQAGQSEEVPRTAGDLLEGRDKLAEIKKKQAAEKAAKEHAQWVREQEAARTRRLDAMKGREEECWRQVEQAIQSKKPKEYDQAVEWLKDLFALADRSDSKDAAVKRIRELRERHRNKSTFIQRLDTAGIPE